ncbi:VWA domain-containing protein [Brevibacterium daeguense]|uniref:VWA domain-containing protein n=1 Tax=Brevibacterium daeguense TaxID=909936 RepID=A0ABP8EIT5_9MICO|nr:VWA domain-containing protein [Brevibacterium daeguense]
MPPRRRSTRYGKYIGGPDPLAPPVDLGEALDAVAEDVMAGYSPEHALREYLRKGGSDREGLDDLAGRVQRRRQELMSRHSLDSTLEEIRRLLDTAVTEERKQLARDIRMDDTDRAFREMLLENLPDSTPAALRELENYDWQSTTAREAAERIQDLLGREMLDQRFEGMKEALENATDADRAAAQEMLRALNELLDKHRRGQATQADFEEFMAAFGQYFPGNPRTIDELIESLAERAAAMSRMLNSMTPEQREELMQLSAQAFGSPELMEQLDRLDENLQALRPGEDWTGEEGEGSGQGLGLAALSDIAELDALAEQLAQTYSGSSLDDIDLEALARQLGPSAAVSAQALSEIEQALRRDGYLTRAPDGELRLSPQAIRRLGKSLLEDAARQLSGRHGQRDTRNIGTSGEATGATREWQFGDLEPWDVSRSVANAVHRTVAEGGDASRGVRLQVGDIEVVETEARTQAAVALLADTSFSMAAEGRWLPMKRMALALHHLVSTRFRGDALELITFSRLAQTVDIAELTALPSIREQGTNLHHALILANRFFRRHPTMQPVLLVVTDGEPTAHLLPDGQSWFWYPPDAETLEATVTELDRVARRGTKVTFFRLGDEPGLARFLDALARRADARVVAPDPSDLAPAVVSEYLAGHGRKGRAGAGETEDLL